LRTSAEGIAAKHVIVTGAGTGIGRATALRLARDGSVVTLVGLDGLEETAALIEGTTHVERCDIRERAAVEASVDRASRKLGPIDGLVAVSGSVARTGPPTKAGTGSTSSSART
jgi:NAD(P)-dependent dehydrogenase (short-subunit alcohol dehydrogenase family)